MSTDDRCFVGRFATFNDACVVGDDSRSFFARRASADNPRPAPT